MTCLRLCKGLLEVIRNPPLYQRVLTSTSRQVTHVRISARTLSIYAGGPIRPTLQIASTSSSICSKGTSLLRCEPTGNLKFILSNEESTLDLYPRITSHPAFSSMQIRCGPRNTFNPSHFVRKRRHGFLSRARTRKGRMTLLRRKSKRRNTLSH